MFRFDIWNTVLSLLRGFWAITARGFYIATLAFAYYKARKPYPIHKANKIKNTYLKRKAFSILRNEFLTYRNGVACQAI